MLVRLARLMWRNRSDVGNSYLVTCLAFQVFLLITARFSESKCPILLSQSRFICREGLPRKGRCAGKYSVSESLPQHPVTIVVLRDFPRDVSLCYTNFRSQQLFR
jgi:hypothetical protein